MLVRAGEDEEASELLDRLLDRRRANPAGLPPDWWITLAALALERLGRSGALIELDERSDAPFLAAALEIDERRFDDAASTLRAIGAPQLEAEVLLLAAREHRKAGDEARADERQSRARELLKRLGATARLREL
jgi:hypothetical protein